MEADAIQAWNRCTTTVRLGMFVSLLVSAGICWWVMEAQVPAGSERFYLLVPIVAGATWLIWTKKTPRELKQQSLRGAMFAVGLGFLGLFLMLLMAYQTMSHRGPGFIEAVRLRELLTITYFFIAVGLLVATAGAIFEQGPLWIEQKLCGDQPAVLRSARITRQLLVKIVPKTLFLGLMFAFLLSTLSVHRMKLVGIDSPQRLLRREYEEVEFTAADGLVIRGWFVPAESRVSSRTVLICHGLGSNKSTFLPFVTVADGLQANVLIFDFRGHGASDGHTVTYGHQEKLDVLAAIDYLRKKRPDASRQIVGIAISFGTASLLRAAAEVEPPLDAVVIDSGFTSLSEMTYAMTWVVPRPIRPLIESAGMQAAELEAGCRLRDIRPIDDIPRIRAPLLIVHAQGDGLIPVDHGRRLFERAASPKRQWIADCPIHGGTLGAEPEAYVQHVRDLFSLVE